MRSASGQRDHDHGGEQYEHGLALRDDEPEQQTDDRQNRVQNWVS